MKTRSVLVLLLLAAAGCKTSAARPGVRLAKPGGVAIFQGYSLRSPSAVKPHLAVASSRGDELRLIDAVDDKVIMSNTVITPLSVPVDPRPALLAAGSLFDPDTSGATPVERPWLLAAASTGMVARANPPAGSPPVASQIQVVATWDAATTVDQSLTIDLAEIPGLEDAVILSLAVAPKPVDDGTGTGTWMAAPGVARLLAGLSGGRLLVVEFTRDPADQLAIVRSAANPAPAVQALGFEPVSMATSPDLIHVYVATPDPIGTVEGVAELDTSAAAGAWPVRGLDARAPTTHVAAGMVGEFLRFRTDQLQSPTPPPWQAAPTMSDVFTMPALRVYASLEPARCGRSAAVACGIAVIDPALGGLLADPAQPPTSVSLTPKQAYLAPIEVPGDVLDMILVMPPKVEPSDVTNNKFTNPPQPPMMVIAPGSGRRLTTAVLAVTSSDGGVYPVDVGHWAIPSEVSIISTFSQSSTTTRVRVSQARNALPCTVTGSDGRCVAEQDPNVPFIALWSDSDLPPSYTNSPSDPLVAGYGLLPDYLYDTKGMVLHPHVTPGYTQGESWSIIFQGKLPGLDRRAGQAVLSTALAAGSTNEYQTTGWVAVQEETGLPGAARFRDVARLYDPALAIHTGDVVVVTAEANTLCTAELQVADLLFPTADYPGGAIQLTGRNCTGANGAAVACPGSACHDALGAEIACPGDPTCLNSATAQPVYVTVRAQALVLTGSGTGYAGRPPIVSDQIGAPLFRFEYQDEDAISCPLLAPGAPWPPAAPCDAACRSQCEQLVLARKARRFYYVTSSLVCTGWDKAHQAMCADTWRNLAWPITTGPVLAFRVGLNNRNTGNLEEQDNNPTALPYTARDAFLVLATSSGVAPMRRVPRNGTVPSGAVMPTGLATFDRSAVTGLVEDGVRVFASYPEDTVLDFSPANGVTDVITIR